MDAGETFRRRALDIMREAANETLSATALEFEERVVERTPEASGEARAGWESDKDPLSVDFFSGESVTFSNKVPYVAKLERGSSDQAPRGMLAVTATEFPNIVDDKVRGRGAK